MLTLQLLLSNISFTILVEQLGRLLIVCISAKLPPAYNPSIDNVEKQARRRRRRHYGRFP
jgi:hypothetical protein